VLSLTATSCGLLKQPDKQKLASRSCDLSNRAVRDYVTLLSVQSMRRWIAFPWREPAPVFFPQSRFRFIPQ
jgi:hypothetical protein